MTLKIDGYWSTLAGQFRRYESRRNRRVLLLEEMEALNKKQSRGGYAMAFQRTIRQRLIEAGRRSFAGPLVLRLRLETSHRQPAPIQTLAKNYLDLLGLATHSDGAEKPRRILYGDDSQVHVLSVSCTHGVDRPSFSLEARRMSDFVADLEYVAYLEREYPELAEHDRMSDYHFDDSLNSLREAAAMSPEERGTDIGRLKQVLAETHDRRVVQEHLLGLGQIRLRELADLCSPQSTAVDDAFLRDVRRHAEERVVKSPFRIELPALPTVGQAERFRDAIKHEVEAFREKLGHLMQPLKMQVGLEVIVRPRHAANESELFDLDNLVRNYLLPHVLEQFRPPSDFLHAVGFEHMPGDTPYLKEMQKRRDALPAGVATGIVQYEIFRLPPAPADSPEGYVTVNLTNCAYGGESVFRRMDDVIAKAQALAGRRR